jgi:hypothetical protein
MRQPCSSIGGAALPKRRDELEMREARGSLPVFGPHALVIDRTVHRGLTSALA